MTTISYGLAATPHGRVLIAATPRGICHLSFVTDKTVTQTLRELQARWPKHTFARDDKHATKQWHSVASAQTTPALHLAGTPFQEEVWEALLKIPFGHTVTYSDVATMIGRPKAVRAVASAIARNEISFVVPCHRVVAKSGNQLNYRWGADVKRRLLDWEMSQS